MIDEQQRERLAEAMRERLGDDAARWVGARCRALLAADQLLIRPEILEELDETGQPVPSSYQPCAAWSD